MIGRHVSEVFTKWEAVLDYLQESTGEPAVVTRGTGEQVEHYDLKITGLVKPDGSNIGRLLVCRNESEKIAAQIKLFESQERFKSLSDAATEAIFISEKGVCLEQNLTAEKMFGFTLDEAVGRMGTEWIVPEHRDQVLENMLSGFEDPYQVTALRKDGSTFEAEIQARMYRYKGRDVRVTALRDITELKEAEAKLRKNLAEKETLLQEIHHRVKNNLQLVVSLLRLQISELADETSINALVDTVNRIHSMAFIHEQLYRSEDFSNIQFNWYIESVLRELTQFHRSGSRIRIDKDLIELNLDIKIAIPCGLILNEAVTNALKHGFPEQRKGLIKVVLEPYQDDRHCLKVSDDGKGLPEGMDPASASTLGMRLMHLLAEQIGGTLSVTRRKGTTVSIIF